MPLHLIDRLEQLFQALGGQILRWTGIMTLLAAANALTVSIPREGWQSIRYGILSLERVQILPQDSPLGS